MPSGRELPRLPLECNRLLCPEGCPVDSGIFLIQRKTVQITPRLNTHTANGTASFYAPTHPPFILTRLWIPAKREVRRGTFWARLLPEMCRQESCENQGLKYQRTWCEPSHTGRDVGSFATNLPQNPSHSLQTPRWPRRSDTMWCSPALTLATKENLHRSVTLLCHKSPGPLYILLLRQEVPSQKLCSAP